MKNPHAHFQSYIKTCVKFQKDQPKTVRGVALTRYLQYSICTLTVLEVKKSKIKMQK